MSFDTNLWNNTTADGGFAENETPAPGHYVVTVGEAKFALTGEGKDKPTIIVEYRTADGKQWADVKQLTSEGRVKSAKILLRDLGLNPDELTSQDTIHAGLKSIEGRYYDVETKDSAAINVSTGKPYRNTSILGRSQVGAPVTPAPVAVGVASTTDNDIPF
jgi:hypothetical protein